MAWDSGSFSSFFSSSLPAFFFPFLAFLVCLAWASSLAFSSSVLGGGNAFSRKGGGRRDRGSR
jgi:hypothetical protein